MALPSSPPAFPQDIPSSPPLPAVQSGTLKRHLSDYESLSSDPIFSEDASESDEVTGVKRKKLYKGPWWRRPGSVAAETRRTTMRNKPVDSGVWMGSEGSDASIDHSERCMGDLALTRDQSPQLPTAPRDYSTTASLPSAVGLAARIVNYCVDTSSQSVDLSDMSLDKLTDETLRPLHQLILSGAMDHAPSSPFMPLIPDISIILSLNNLTSLPSELWRLRNITVLSLRNNNLSEIPEFVGRLQRLKELNIAGNQVEWLPWELLDLLHYDSGEKPLQLVAHPNPIIQPLEPALLEREPALTLSNRASIEAVIRRAHDKIDHGYKVSTYESMVLRVAERSLRRYTNGHLCPSDPVYAASSDVSYFDVDGSPVRPVAAFTSFSASQVKPCYDAITGPPASPPGRASAAPSMFELAARSCRQSTFHRQLPLLLPIDAADRVVATLYTAIGTRGDMEPRCSVCTRAYIVKRAEWIEYWHCNIGADNVPSSLVFTPFMRRACSWMCASRAAEDNLSDER